MLRRSARGLMLDVRATPKAARDEIKGWRDGLLQVRVTVVPEGGKANDAIQSLLAKASGAPKSAFLLVQGETSRQKTFLVASHAEAVQAWAEGLRKD
jgi:hypothetical protein